MWEPYVLKYFPPSHRTHNEPSRNRAVTLIEPKRNRTEPKAPRWRGAVDRRQRIRDVDAHQSENDRHHVN